MSMARTSQRQGATYAKQKTKKFCLLIYKGSTTNMINHVQAKHHSAYEERFPRPYSSTLQPNQSQTALSLVYKKCPPARAKELDGLVAGLVAEDLRPISTVSGTGFKKLVHCMEPGYTVPSRTHVMSTLRKRYGEVKEQLIQRISSHYLAIMTDIWTSKATEAYITITGHYIDENWNLQNCVLTTKAMPEKHTGLNIAERIRETMVEWQVADECVSGIVHDNAASMLAAVDDLGWNHMSCFAHTLQLAINKGLDNPTISKVSAAARKLVGHFKHSAAAMTELKEKQKHLNVPQHHLIQDVSTRWNSTFFMLQMLVEQRWAIFTVLANEHSSQYKYRNLNPKDSQWQLMSQLITVLEPLQVATTALCELEIVSCSLIFPVINGLLSNHLQENEDDLSAVAVFKKAVRDQIELRFDVKGSIVAGSIPVLAAALDPHYHHMKFLNTFQCTTAFEEIVEQVKELTRSQPESASDDSDQQPPPKKRKTALSFLIGEDGTADEIPEQEVRNFRSLPILKEDQSTLEWWRNNAEQYPILAKIAKMYLCIPATSVPAQRVFSIAGLIVYSQRASLSTENVDMVVFLNKNM